MLRRSRICPGVWLVPAGLLIVAPSFAAELTVKVDQTSLRAACGEAGEPIAVLPAGKKVRLRFVLSASPSPCYAVTADVEGRRLQGFVSREGVDGMEPFERSRRQASSDLPSTGTVSVEEAMGGELKISGFSPTEIAGIAGFSAAAPHVKDALRKAGEMFERQEFEEAERLLAALGPEPGDPSVPIYRAQALLRLARVDSAHRVIQAALRTYPEHPRVLAFAGLALYFRDDLPGARSSLKRSLAFHSNTGVAALVRKIDRELAGDKSGRVTYGTRFVLRYEDQSLSPADARRVRDAFESEVSRISFQLGCESGERVTVILQSGENFRNTTGSAKWSGGSYDGKIRIVLGEGGIVDDQVRRSLSHEFVHACLTRRGSWPGWFHEGVAQHLSGVRLTREKRALLRQAHEANGLPKLDELGIGWMSMHASEAEIAYLLGLAAAEILYRDPFRVRNLLANPSRLPELAAVLDKQIRGELR